MGFRLGFRVRASRRAAAVDTMWKWRPYTPMGCGGGGGAACHVKAFAFSAAQQFSLVLPKTLPFRV